jgi:hypothetical protein
MHAEIFRLSLIREDPDPRSVWPMHGHFFFDFIIILRYRIMNIVS